MLENSDMEDLVNLTSISEQEILNMINKSEQEAKAAAEGVDQLGKDVIECPNCKHKFERKDR